MTGNETICVLETKMNIESYNPHDPVQYALMTAGIPAAIKEMEREAPPESEYASCVSRALAYIQDNRPLGLEITSGQIRFIWD